MIAKINGVRLFFDVLSDGLRSERGHLRIKPPLFVLHGGPGMDHQGIKPAVMPLADRFQVVTFDQRGSGLSERVPVSHLSMAVMARDIEGLRRYLGFNRIILMGISYGGMLALDYALRFPKSLLALILVVTAPSFRVKEQARRIADRLDDRKLRSAAYKILDGDIRNNDDFKETLARLASLYAREGNPRKTRRGLRNARINYRVVTWFFKRACCRYDVIDRLHQIETPTLIVGAERDWICPIDQSRLMHRKIKGSRLVVIQDGRHMCFVEDNNLFVRSVRRFLGENCA